MTWCGVVRYGVGRYGVVRYGVGRYGGVRYGVGRYGVVRYGVGRYGGVRYGVDEYRAGRGTGRVSTADDRRRCWRDWCSGVLHRQRGCNRYVADGWVRRGTVPAGDRRYRYCCWFES